MEVLVVDHPLVRARLTTLRAADTAPAEFRAALRELATMLVYEATRDLGEVDRPVRTPVGPTVGRELAEPPLLVPILRAGLGMAEAALALLPEARMGFVGLSRDETTFRPHAYLTAVPDDLSGRSVLVLDPMLATGGSLLHCCRLLAERGAAHLTVVCVLAAPEGLDAVAAAGLPIRVVTAAVDDRLDERRFIVPGLGDAGDRQFGAV